MEFSVVGALLWGSAGALLFWVLYTWRLGSFRQHALQIMHHAERDAEMKTAACTLEIQRTRQQHEQQMQKERLVLEGQERNLKSQALQIAHDVERLKKDQARLQGLEKDLEEKKLALTQVHSQAIATLEKTAHLSFDEARATLIKKAEEESRNDIERQKTDWQRRFEADCERRALCLLFGAIERKVQSLTKEIFLLQIPLKDRSLIPRFIGKDGRNIQMLESLLDVCILIEEAPPCLLISSHNPQARFIAKATVEQLIDDEKITPVTIRSAHEKATASFSQRVEELGRGALLGCEALKTMPKEVLTAIGQLSFRSSAGQNVLAHSIEVAEMMGILAAELGLNTEMSKMMGLLHDIGKGLAPEWGESHSLAGKRFLEKWGVQKEIANAVASHHGEIAPCTEEAQLLPVCDRISAQLPGARTCQEPAFLSMVRSCEFHAKDLPGVVSVWAHYAGNHIELIVRHSQVIERDSLRKSLQESLLPAHLPIPVTITLCRAPDTSSRNDAS